MTLQALRQAHAFRTFSWQQQQQGGAGGHGGAGGEEGEGDGGLDEEEALALLDPHYRGAASDAHHHHHHQEHQHQHEHPTAHGSENGHQEHAGLGEGEVMGEGGRGCNGGEQGARVEAEGPQPNGAAHGGGGGGCGCGGAGGGPPEPTRREWRAAVREAMQVGDRLRQNERTANQWKWSRWEADGDCGAPCKTACPQLVATLAHAAALHARDTLPMPPVAMCQLYQALPSALSNDTEETVCLTRLHRMSNADVGLFLHSI